MDTGTTTLPQPYSNAITPPNDTVSHSHSHPSSSTSLIKVLIVISSAVLVTALIYVIIRFLSRRYNRTNNNSVNEHVNDHMPNHVQTTSITNNADVENTLPVFTFSSLTGNLASGDCAVCLSKFEKDDQLKLLPLCCHAFHALCIDVWLKNNNTCPLCRASVNPSESELARVYRNNSFRIEIGSISSNQREPTTDGVGSRSRSYSVGSFDYVLDVEGYEVAVDSTRHRGGSDVDKEATTLEAPGENVAAEVGSGRRNWLRDYVDRVSVTLSSRNHSLRGGSGRFFGGSSRRNESVVDDLEASHGRIGEEISEFFRWFSGV